MKIDGYYVKDKILKHYKENRTFYIVMLVAILAGVVLGIYLSVTGYKYTSLLNSSDKHMFDYITGKAEYSSIFSSRFFQCFFCLLLIFLFNLTFYTCFLNYIYIGYQTSLLVLTCFAITSIYGFSGVINVVLILLPINIIWIFIICVWACFCRERAKLQYKYKSKIFESFKLTNLGIKFLFCFLVMLILCVLQSFVLPLLIKSVIVINY